jgi:hypothetical protein
MSWAHSFIFLGEAKEHWQGEEPPGTTSCHDHLVFEERNVPKNTSSVLEFKTIYSTTLVEA